MSDQPDLLAALRGVAWTGDAETPYPRADPADLRISRDTWATAQLPVGVRLELTGDAAAVEIDYACATDDFGYRGPQAGDSFSAWRGGQEIATTPAAVSGGTARLELTGNADDVVTVYLPEGMRPTIVAVRAVGGALAPAFAGPRWLAYGDSITEGWVASGPAHAWPAIAARRLGFDVVNLGYAGSARGDIASAEQLAALPADVISLAYGTNCWTRPPLSRRQFREGFRAFLAVVRQGHPTTPIVVLSPVLRPDAEQTPNRLGASLGHLREEVEDVVTSLQQGGADQLHLVRGLPLLNEGQLADGVHPGDEGQEILATVVGDVLGGLGLSRLWGRAL